MLKSFKETALQAKNRDSPSSLFFKVKVSLTYVLYTVY